eukprot:9586828-Karenia_brevis.AAC.1
MVEQQQKYEQRFYDIETKQKAHDDLLQAHAVLHEQYGAALQMLRTQFEHQAQQIQELHTSFLQQATMHKQAAEQLDNRVKTIADQVAIDAEKIFAIDPAYDRPPDF